MSKMDEYKAKMRERKAAALGMTVEQFDAHVVAEQRRIDDIRNLAGNYTRAWAAIAANANFHKRSFHKLG